jgi:hypothetical protein
MEPDFKGKTVFVSGPYSSPDEEVKANRFKKSAIACGLVMDKGGFPLSPIVHGVPIVNVMRVTDDFQYWKDYCMALVGKSDFLIVLQEDGWEESAGVKGEIEAAHELGKPVYLYSFAIFQGGIFDLNFYKIIEKPC